MLAYNNICKGSRDMRLFLLLVIRRLDVVEAKLVDVLGRGNDAGYTVRSLTEPQIAGEHTESSHGGCSS